MDVNRQRYKQKVMQKLGITPECKQRLKPPAEMNSSLSLSALPDASLIASLRAALWPFFFSPSHQFIRRRKKKTQNAEAVAGSKSRRRHPVRSHTARVIKSKERGSRGRSWKNTRRCWKYNNKTEGKPQGCAASAPPTLPSYINIEAVAEKQHPRRSPHIHFAILRTASPSSSHFHPPAGVRVPPKYGRACSVNSCCIFFHVAVKTTLADQLISGPVESPDLQGGRRERASERGLTSLPAPASLRQRPLIFNAGPPTQPR